MSNESLTIRLPQRYREALRRKAATMKVKESTWVRYLIERDIGDQSLGTKLSGLRGSIDSGATRSGGQHPLADGIRDRNWRQ